MSNSIDLSGDYRLIAPQVLLAANTVNLYDYFQLNTFHTLEHAKLYQYLATERGLFGPQSAMTTTTHTTPTAFTESQPPSSATIHDKRVVERPLNAQQQQLLADKKYSQFPQLDFYSEIQSFLVQLFQLETSVIAHRFDLIQDAIGDFIRADPGLYPQPTISSSTPQLDQINTSPSSTTMGDTIMGNGDDEQIGSQTNLTSAPATNPDWPTINTFCLPYTPSVSQLTSPLQSYH